MESFIAQHGHRQDHRDMRAHVRNSNQMHYYDRAHDQFQQFHHRMDYRNFYQNQAHHFQRARIDERFPPERFQDEINRRHGFYEQNPYQDRFKF